MLILRSRRRFSTLFQLQTARVCSRITFGLPKARRAAWRPLLLTSRVPLLFLFQFEVRLEFPLQIHLLS
jgi:hypothetical protein